MLLVVDVGNTNITLGVFEGDILKKVFRLDSNKTLGEAELMNLFKEKLKNFAIEGCMVASVVNELTEKVKNTCDNLFKGQVILFDKKTNINNILDCKKPSEVGADRIANAYAVYKKYKLPAVVIDFGTATTLEIISKQGKYIGGIIMPGLDIQTKALNLYTSKLPKVKIKQIGKIIGTDTETCILSGVVGGTACAVDGLIKKCEEEMNEKVTTIATGGFCEIVSKNMTRKIDFINQNLTLEGLKYIYENNVKKQ